MARAVAGQQSGVGRVWGVAEVHLIFDDDTGIDRAGIFGHARPLEIGALDHRGVSRDAGGQRGKRDEHRGDLAGSEGHPRNPDQILPFQQAGGGGLRRRAGGHIAEPGGAVDVAQRQERYRVQRGVFVTQLDPEDHRVTHQADPFRIGQSFLGHPQAKAEHRIRGVDPGRHGGIGRSTLGELRFAGATGQRERPEQQQSAGKHCGHRQPEPTQHGPTALANVRQGVVDIRMHGLISSGPVLTQAADANRRFARA